MPLNRTQCDKKGTEATLKPWFHYLKLLFTALSKLSSSRLTVYRGIKLDLSKQYPIRKRIAWWEFSSCTTHAHMIEQFLGNEGDSTMFIVDCSFGKNICNHSFFEAENDILLLPGIYFEVVRSFSPAKNFHIIQLQEIEPDVPLLPMLTNSSASILNLSKLDVTNHDLQSVLAT